MVRKNNKNNNNSKKARRAARSKGPAARGAPVAVSQDMQQFTRFSGQGDTLRMHTCAAVASLVRSTNDPSVCLGISDGNDTSFCSMQLNLTQPAGLLQNGTKTNGRYISPVFDLIASAFVRYRVRKLILHYEPQAAATQTERMVFAYAEDPMHPILWNATIPTQSGLLAVSDSIAFAPWRSWSMDVTHRISGQKFYTFTDPSTSTASFAERFSDFGVISCLSTGVGNGIGPIKTGVLYMECEIEFEEFCPISVTLPASKHLAQRFGAAAASSSSSYAAPKSSLLDEISEREARRLCEDTVRLLEERDPKMYAYFRKTWKEDIEGRPHALLKDLRDELNL